jgi:hypothetical protein
VGIGVPAGALRVRFQYAHQPPLLTDAADRYGVSIHWVP